MFFADDEYSNVLWMKSDVIKNNTLPLEFVHCKFVPAVSQK